MVLTYAIVEVQEASRNYSICTDAFKTLIDYYHAEIDEINKTIEKEIAHGIPIIESKTTNGHDHEAGHELTEEEEQRVKQEEELRTNVTSLYKPKLEELREAAASIWITEMRFARRTEVRSYDVSLRCLLPRSLFDCLRKLRAPFSRA